MSAGRSRGVLGVLGIGIGACLACACGSSSSGAQATPPSTSTRTTPIAAGNCRPPRVARVVAAGHEAVVYTLPHLLRGGPVPSARRQGVAIVGCLASSGRRVPLGSVTRVERLALNGAAVAYATTAVHGIDTIATNLVVADLRRGHQLFNVPAGRISIAPHFVSIDAIAVTPGGTVAWIQHGGTLESPGYSVHTATPARPTDHQVASSPAIDPHSLELTRATVSWVQAGRRHSGLV